MESHRREKIPCFGKFYDSPNGIFTMYINPLLEWKQLMVDGPVSILWWSTVMCLDLPLLFLKLRLASNYLGFYNRISNK